MDDHDFLLKAMVFHFWVCLKWFLHIHWIVIIIPLTLNHLMVNSPFSEPEDRKTPPAQPCNALQVGLSLRPLQSLRGSIRVFRVGIGAAALFDAW